MASVQTYSKGRRRVRFRDHQDNERSLALGKIPMRAARSAADHIQALVNAKGGGFQPDAEHVKWAGEQKNRRIDSLADLGLIPERKKPAAEKKQKTAPTLGDWFDVYIATRNASESTKTVWKRAKRLAGEYFTLDRRIDQIKVVDAFAWFESIQKTKSDNTARKMVGVTRRVFKHAVKAEIIPSNPFHDDELPVTVGAREKRYIDHSVIREVLNILPSAEWKAVVVLARIGGLRVQSEAPLLKWSDVDWSANRIAVFSPKTKKARQVPLFPDVRQALEDLLPITGDGEYVLRVLREKSTNWRTPLEKMLTRAGIDPWPSLFNALRSSAAIDIRREYGMAEVVEWVGHSEAVALKHYQRSIDADFTPAASGAPKLVTQLDTKTCATAKTWSHG